jgi:hypothetical protein
VTTVLGVVESVESDSVTVAGKKVPFDFLVAATGFSMPLIQPALGMTFEV